jgi:hypothetical protein
MQFIGMPKPIDISGSILPKPVADWMHTESVQSMYIILPPLLWLDMLVSWVIKSSKSWIWYSIMNSRDKVWAISDFTNHDWIETIPNPGSQTRVTLLLESIYMIPFQARASIVKIPKLRPHSINCGMLYFINDFGTLQVTRYQHMKIPGPLCRFPADIFLMLPIVRYSSEACQLSE